MLFRFFIVGLLFLIIIRQRKIMSDLDTLNEAVAEVTADETIIATDLGTIIKDFQDAEAALAAEQPINLAGPIAALQALHVKLQADAAAVVAAEPATTATPAASVEPSEAPAAN